MMASITLSSCILHAQALHLQPPYDTSGSKDIELWPHSDIIIDDAKKVAIHDGAGTGVWADGKDTYKIELNEETYYITANHYLVETTEELHKAAISNSTKMTPGHCAFYIYDKDLNYVSSYVAKIGNGNDTTCNSIPGVSGVSFKGKPALMAVIQYFYTDGGAAKTIAELDNKWIRATILMTLVKQNNGKWAFSQDFTCFNSINTVATLAEAKEKLKICNQ